MYDETNVPGPEIRVRPVVRYLVTTFYHPYTQSNPNSIDGKGFLVPGGSKVVCECENERQADEVANALQSLHDHVMQAISDEKPAQQEDSPQH